MAKSLVLASLPSDINSPSAQPNTDIPKHSVPLPKTKTASTTLPRKRSGIRQKQQQSKLQQQLTIIQIERAVGAGSYRDNEPKERKDSIFKGLMPNSSDAKESTAESKIRETGEWLANTTEEKFQSAGKRILLFTFQWVLPIYIFSFLVATGAVKLPFDAPWLDDLIM